MSPGDRLLNWVLACCSIVAGTVATIAAQLVADFSTISGLTPLEVFWATLALLTVAFGLAAGAMLAHLESLLDDRNDR
jgi:hypothetical protein